MGYTKHALHKTTNEENTGASTNGLSLPAVSVLQKAAPEEELQMKSVVQKAAPEEELQMKAIVQKAAPEEELQMKAVIQKAAPEEELQMKGIVQKAAPEEELQMKAVIQKAAPEEELQMKSIVQRAAPEEELQMKCVVQKAAPEEELQMKSVIQKKENKTGMPDNLKSGIENLSGMDMSDVKVHYNSSQPAQLNALAYAQGSDIHIGPGQEQHLAHEAWHVVQQRQGRVKPTMQMKQGVAVNDDPGLEHEADVMGAKALQMRKITDRVSDQALVQKKSNDGIVQRLIEIADGPGAGMYAGENPSTLLDRVATVINGDKRFAGNTVKRGPLKMYHDASNIYTFPTLVDLAGYMTAGYEQYVKPKPLPPLTLVYGADHGDYHFTGKVTTKKAQWTVSKSKAQGLMEAAIARYSDKLRKESNPVGWTVWYIGEDAGEVIGDTVSGVVGQFTIQFQVNLSENVVSYHGYPDQRLKKTGIGKSKSSITDAED
jgi:hypothetical protein